MGAPRLSYQESLEPLVDSGVCLGCASCVAVCPIGCLEHTEDGPTLASDCPACGVCQHACPRYASPDGDMERLVFGRERRPDEVFGIYRRVVLAQSTDPEVQAVCQDGGLVTTILRYGLSHDLIDGAAVSGVSKDEPLRPLPVLASTPEDVLRCAGTRYSFSPNLLAYRDGVNLKRKDLAFVGTPCQVRAIRRIQLGPLKKYSRPLRLVVGLMCTKAFTYGGFMDRVIHGGLGIDPGDVRKVNIKGQVMVTTSSGEEATLPIRETGAVVRSACLTCTDFSSELADISAGALGLLGRTVAVVRTEAGDRVLDGAERAGLVRTEPLGDDSLALVRLSRTARRKRDPGPAGE